MVVSSLPLWGLITAATASPLLPRDTSTSVVDFSNNTGTPNHLASGILYGVPDTPNQIASQFYTNMGFNYLRAGGAQLPSPALGWIWGFSQYQNRFASVLSNYGTAQQYNAPFVFLIHDLWGADGTQNSSAPYPGDNGDWSFYDSYLDQLISDMNANSMIKDVIIDIWNEPDGGGFWARTQDQYLQMWGRAYYRFRGAFGETVLLSGPATAGEPLPGNQWWENYLSFISSNNSIPDQYVWHMESGGGDMLSSQGGLLSLLSQYNLPTRQVNINEYSIYSEQVPSGSAWWISQLERVNAIGLRGNWLSGYALHDFLSSLLSKPNADTSSYSPTEAGYWTNGDYQVYQYYNLNMTGYRVGTLPSGDLELDTYATIGTDGLARVLAGVRVNTGTWNIQLDNLSNLGLPTSGTLNIHTWGFAVAQDVYYGEVTGPNDLGYAEHTYSGNSVSFPVYQTDDTTAYAFEFAIGSS